MLRRLSWCACFGLLGTSCVMDEEFQTLEGAPPSEAEVAAYVAERSVAPTPASAAAAPLSLVDALKLATEGSTDLAEVRAQVLQSAANVDLARSALIPKFAISAQVLAYAKPQGTGGFFQRDKELFDLNVEFSIPLDLSGRLKESLRAAQARYRAEKARKSVALREARFLAATAFFNLSSALELRGVQAALIDAQQRALSDAKTRFTAGVLRENDVLTTEVALAETRRRAEEAETAIQDARRALNAATGLPIGHPTEIVSWPTVLALDSDPLPFLELARRDNPEVGVLVETRQALLREYEAADRASLPDVSIGPRASYSSDSLAEPSFLFSGLISASWNPDFNGEVKARTDAVSAEIAKNAAQCSGLLRRLESRLLEAQRRYVDRTFALRTAVASTVQARENVRIFGEQFRAGTATAREVLEAQALAAETEAVARTARHQANLAVAEAWFTAGTDLVEALEAAAK